MARVNTKKKNNKYIKTKTNKRHHKNGGVRSTFENQKRSKLRPRPRYDTSHHIALHHIIVMSCVLVHGTLCEHEDVQISKPAPHASNSRGVVGAWHDWAGRQEPIWPLPTVAVVTCATLSWCGGVACDVKQRHWNCAHANCQHKPACAVQPHVCTDGMLHTLLWQARWQRANTATSISMSVNRTV